MRAKIININDLNNMGCRMCGGKPKVKDGNVVCIGVCKNKLGKIRNYTIDYSHDIFQGVNALDLEYLNKNVIKKEYYLRGDFGVFSTKNKHYMTSFVMLETEQLSPEKAIECQKRLREELLEKDF